jgi:hypothetical protein
MTIKYFVELKRKWRGGWLSDVREKFEKTIMAFKINDAGSVFKITKPIIFNKIQHRTPKNLIIKK